MNRSVSGWGLFAAALAFAWVLCVLHGRDARANMAKLWNDGEAHGALVPQNDTDVRVDSEDLSFVVAPTLDTAEVTATYHMTNAGKEATRAEVAFVMVGGELGGEESSPAMAHASIAIDGERVPSRIVSEADVLEPALDAWLVKYPAAEAELVRLTAPTMEPRQIDCSALRRYAPGCTGECTDLLRWYRVKKRHDSPGDRANEGLVRRAANEAVPTQVAALQNGWSKFTGGRHLSWLAFPLEIAAGASRTVVVRYTHNAGDDMSRAVNQVFTYEYLLSPAKRWARFGELHVTIQLPPASMIHASSLPFVQEGSGPIYRANLPALPAGELTFEVMSRSGLLFGMTQPTGYWLLLIAAMALVTAPIAKRLGRVFGREPSRVWRAVGCILGTGFATLVSNGLVVTAISAVFPQHAFGYGYGAVFGLIAVVFLLTIGAITVSFVIGARSRR